MHRNRIVLIIAALGVLLALSVGIVLAVWNLSLFELDRNALDDVPAAVPGDDWDTLYGGGGSAKAFTGVLHDIAPAPLTQFHGGGSKDPLKISEWLWTPGEPLDKDDITNAYAAAYVNPSKVGIHEAGDLIIYFGLDRYANNGSAQVGFWFFQQEIARTNIPSKGGFKFSGVHEVGDILVQSNFTQGGTLENLSVFQWVGSGGSHGSLDLVYSGADCMDGMADAKACATVNRGDTPSPWPYTPKFGTPGSFPRGSFFEGGVNLTQLLQKNICLRSVMAETRSSTPFNSRLKDFVLGEFDLCRIDVDKMGDILSKVGDDVEYTITITNTGAVKLYKDDISDDVLGAIAIDGTNVDPNGFIVSNNCGASLLAGNSCTITATRTVLGTDPDPLVNTVTVVYNSSAGPAFAGTALTRTDDHSVNLFQPSITFDKTGDTLSKIGDDVDYTITITNTSSLDTPDLECTITDAMLGIDELVTLAYGESHVITDTYTVLETDPDPLVNTANASCSPIGWPNILPASDGHSVNLFQPDVDAVKTGDSLSKVGDSVDYTITITNTSSLDSPNLVSGTITDTVLGNLLDGANPYVTSKTCLATLPTGSSCVIEATRTVLGTDPDPLENTVVVHYNPLGFPNDITDSDGHSVNLFQPDYTLSCWTASDIATVGDTIEYQFTLHDLSDPDTPEMALVSALSSLLGDVASSFPNPLADDVVSLYYTVQASDPATLVHGVTTVYSPLGFPNQYERYAACTVTVKAGCMLSPGFWGGGEGRDKWDESLDPVAVAAAFTTDTPFPWVDASLEDPTPGDGITYLDMFNLPALGDVTRQLAFKYVAARLNVALADVLGLPVHSGLVDLLDDIDAYFVAHPVGSKPTGPARDEGRALLSDLNAIFTAVGEEYCPATGDVPEWPWP